jgi:hypothetical protein
VTSPGNGPVADVRTLMSEAEVARALGVGHVSVRGDARACTYTIDGISAVQLTVSVAGSAQAATAAASAGKPIDAGAAATASIEAKAAGVRAVVVAVAATLATLAITSPRVTDESATELARLLATRL